MKHSLPILPAVALGVLAAIGLGLGVAHYRKAPRREPNPSTSQAAVVEAVPAPQAGALLAQATRQLATHETVSAAVSVSSNFFGEPLVATGQYLQGPRDSRRLRMDLKVQLGEKVCSLMQVCDGQALWIRRNTLIQSSLSRIDVPRALAGIQQAGHRPGVDNLALGGLALLLDSLGRAADFQALRNDRCGRVPTFVVVGTWKNSLLVHFAPDQKQAIEAGTPADLTRLPAHVPNQIEVFIGRDDLFPYKIEFLRVAKPGSRSDIDPVLASLKFENVHFDLPLDAREFLYQSGDTVPVDETQAFIDRAMVR